MNETTNDASKSAQRALREIESRLRNDGYDEAEVLEVCLAAQTKLEELLGMSDQEIDFSEIIADFTSPEWAPERSDQKLGANPLGLIALLFSLIIVVLFATIPFIAGDEAGGAAMLTLALIVSPIGAILGWKSRHQQFGKIALGVSTLPIIGLFLSVALHVLE